MVNRTELCNDRWSAGLLRAPATPATLTRWSARRYLLAFDETSGKMPWQKHVLIVLGGVLLVIGVLAATAVVR